MPNSIKAVVSGGGGFLGRYLCQTLIRRRLLNGRQLESIAILDAGKDTEIGCDTDVHVFPNRPDSDPPKSIKVERFRGDITDKALVAEVLKPKVQGQHVAVFHLASIMSAQGEMNFDKCLEVNLHGTINMLEEARTVHKNSGHLVRFINPSSLAAYGGSLKEVDDGSRLMPESTYGTTKAMGELLVNDFTRKGWVDGRTARLPTVIVRPGSANGAATGCFSAIVREVLMGNAFEIPIDPRQKHPVVSINKTIKGLITLSELPPDSLGHDRSVNLPSIQATLDDLLFHTQQIAVGRGIPLGEVQTKIDPLVSRVINSMPQIMHASRAKALALPRDRCLEDIVETYISEFLEDEMDDQGYPLLSV